MPYALPPAYRSQSPARYAPAPGGPIWQPDVIPLAARLAEALGAEQLIDVGCSTAAKLLAFAERFELIGLDLADQLPADPRGRWIPCDLSSARQLPVEPGELERSVLICADVIEHLERPEILARALADALDRGARAVVLSTPDRDRLYGPGQLGPPRNPCHAREWAAPELIAFLEAERLPISAQLWQRANDRSQALQTAVVISSPWELAPIL